MLRNKLYNLKIVELQLKIYKLINKDANNSSKWLLMCNAFTSTQGPMHLWGGQIAVMLAKYISHLQRYFHTTLYIYWQGRERTPYLCLFQQNPRAWVQVRALENLGFGGQFLTYYSRPGMNIFFSLPCVYSVIGNGISTQLQKVEQSIIIL